MGYYNKYKISDMVGVVMVDVVNRDNVQLLFTGEDGTVYKFYHEQDCCESVDINDICGDLNDLIGHPILLAEEVNSEGNEEISDGAESYTWTFYKFSTIKGSVTVRWYGESNGYYSEEVDFVIIPNKA